MSALKKFTKDFTLQEPIPEKGMAAANEVMCSGKLHRYNVSPGEKSQTVLLEEEFAAYMGKKYCLALSSCGSAMYIALKSFGVGPGDKVLCNAYTLAPVPGAIQNTGACVELVEIVENCTIDIEDLDRKAASPDAKFLLLSHMRGHIADMESILSICKEHGLILIEDCAHTMGASWNGVKSGTFGHAGCFSTQTYKHINSGEGGLLVTDDEEAMARAIIYSGSYMLYESHTAAPDSAVFERVKYDTPNYSNRMDNLRASLLRPQLENLDAQCQRWNERYRLLEELLGQIAGVECVKRSPGESYVGSSIQFSLHDSSPEQVKDFLETCASRGVHIKWFGGKEPVGFTSAYHSWRYMKDIPDLPNTDRILSTMCDMRVPLTFDLDDCRDIAAIIKETAVMALTDHK